MAGRYEISIRVPVLHCQNYRPERTYQNTRGDRGNRYGVFNLDGDKWGNLPRLQSVMMGILAAWFVFIVSKPKFETLESIVNNSGKYCT